MNRTSDDIAHGDYGTAHTPGRICVRCAHDLGTLPPTATCPECGTPVSESLQRALLRYSPPRYVARVRSGLNLVLYGVLLAIVFFVLFMLAAYLSGRYSGPRPDAFLWVAVVIGAPIYAMVLVGYWRFTAPEPGSPFAAQTRTVRKIVRASLAVQAALQFAGIILQFSTDRPAGEIALTPPTLIGWLLALLGSLAWAAQFFAVMVYARVLSRRLPDRHILRRISIYLWLLPILSTVGTLLVVGPLVAMVLYWNLLNRLRIQLRAIETTGEPARLAAAIG